MVALRRHVKIQVTEELIQQVAKNARLTLTKEEVRRFVPQFKEILHHFSKISKVPTENVPLALQPIQMRNRLRNDLVKPSLSVEDALFNTKHKKENYFKGPKIV